MDTLKEGSQITILVFVFKLASSAFLSFLITRVYSYTHKSLSYVYTFSHTLIVVGISTCAVLVIIGNSLPMAFGLLGALSIVRFRTALKDSRDTGYLLLVITVCMALAQGLYLVASTLTAFSSALLMVLNKFEYGKKQNVQKILKVQLPKDQDMNILVPSLKKHFVTWELLESSSNVDGTNKECVFLVTNRKNQDVEEGIMADLKHITGNHPIQFYGYSQNPIL